MLNGVQGGISGYVWQFKQQAQTLIEDRLGACIGRTCKTRGGPVLLQLWVDHPHGESVHEYSLNQHGVEHQ